MPYSYARRCNHRCKGKINCGHMWCVFSIILSVKPCPQVFISCRVAPQVQLNSQPLKEPLKPKAPSSLQRLHPTNKGSASTDRKMKELTSIDERTQVSQNMKRDDCFSGRNVNAKSILILIYNLPTSKIKNSTTLQIRMKWNVILTIFLRPSYQLLARKIYYHGRIRLRK
jgi:hypothetical protein